MLNIFARRDHRKATKKGAIIFILDSNYLLPFKVLAFTLRDALRERSEDIIILSDDPLVAEDPIIETVGAKVVTLSYEDIERLKEVNSRLIQPGYKTHSLSAYWLLKFYAFKDMGYQYHIFLDADMLCLNSAFRFDRLKFHADLAAARTVGPIRLGLTKKTDFRSLTFAQKLSVIEATRKLFDNQSKKEHPNINSGVLYIGSRMIGDHVVDSLVTMATEEAFHYDQDVVHAYLLRNPNLSFEPLPISLNFPTLPAYCVGEDLFREHFLERISILHYNRKPKPWRVGRNHDFLVEFWWQQWDMAQDWIIPGSHRNQRPPAQEPMPSLYALLRDVLPDDHARQSRARDEVRAQAARGFAPSEVLDLGCGKGDSIDFFRSALPGARWVGADIELSPEVLARERRDGEFVTFDGMNLPFDAGSFGLVYSHQVFEHVRHPESLLAEVRRVLRAEGLLIGQTSQLEPYHSFSLWNYTPYGFRCLLEAAGLRLVLLRPGIDGLTLIERALLGKPKEWSKWFSTRVSAEPEDRSRAPRAGPPGEEAQPAQAHVLRSVCVRGGPGGLITPRPPRRGSGTGRVRHLMRAATRPRARPGRTPGTRRRSGARPRRPGSPGASRWRAASRVPSAQVSGTSPGCSGRSSRTAVRPSACSSAAMKSASSTGAPLPML